MGKFALYLFIVSPDKLSQYSKKIDEIIPELNILSVPGYRKAVSLTRDNSFRKFFVVSPNAFYDSDKSGKSLSKEIQEINPGNRVLIYKINEDTQSEIENIVRLFKSF